jgi:hypothetical protein
MVVPSPLPAARGGLWQGREVILAASDRVWRRQVFFWPEERIDDSRRIRDLVVRRGGAAEIRSIVISIDMTNAT